jgi:hypothetical protein
VSIGAANYERARFLNLFCKQLRATPNASRGDGFALPNLLKGHADGAELGMLREKRRWNFVLH